MPKKFPVVKKREWLQNYENGKSEISIARENHCDIRTVKKGIDEIRRERDTLLARSDLIKESLRNHNQRLLSLIRELIPIIIPMPFNQVIPRSELLNTDLYTFSGGSFRYQQFPQLQVLSITLNVETKVEWEYLQEHLKRDHFETMFRKWKKTLVSHYEARMVLVQRFTRLLREHTGYQLSHSPADSPCLYTSVLDILLPPIIEWLLVLKDARSPLKNIDINPGNDEIRYNFGTAIAYAPGDTQRCKDNIINALNELKTSSEAVNVVTTYKQNADWATKAKHAAEEIDMMGLVPGRCRICQRLGI